MEFVALGSAVAAAMRAVKQLEIAEFLWSSHHLEDSNADIIRNPRVNSIEV